MWISEIYQSRQGEGQLTGTSCVFIRTSGCNLRCQFCDTPYTSWTPTGEIITIPQIVDRTLEYGVNHVVITGGEPMLPREIVELTKSIKREGKHITIETAGTVYREVECDLMSISPKLSNSTPDAKRAGQWRAKHESIRDQPKVINRLLLQYQCQLKYVVAEALDLREIECHLANIDSWNPGQVLLMPEGVDQIELDEKRKWLEPLCEKFGFAFCPRMHIQWYGNQRCT